MPFDSAPAESIERRRLRILAEFLPSVPPERLRLRRWSSWGFSPAACGTAACACGWATTIPEFAAAGFRLVSGQLAYDKRYDWTAAEKFFGLTHWQSDRLFARHTYGDEDPTPADVAARIHEHLERTEGAQRAVSNAFTQAMNGSIDPTRSHQQEVPA